jgi:hypothetical protein
MTVIASRSINRREEFRVQAVSHPGGNTVVMVGRWKADTAGEPRLAGKGVAFDVSRMPVFVELIQEASAALKKGGRA